jgi:hypothetical protein
MEIWRFISEKRIGYVMPMREKIIQMLFSAIDEINQLLPAEEQLEKDLATPLAGDFGRLDSAGLINLIVVTEQKTADELGRPILLTDDRTLSQVDRVFRTLGTLAGYIEQLVSEIQDG